MATKRNPMADKLAQTLDRTNKATKGKPKPAPAPTAPGGCTKVSVSLYDADVERVNAIIDHMAHQGHRISRSQAIKLALRTAPLDAGLVDALEATRRDDGRGKW